MFSTNERLAKRTPHNGIDRASYIHLLAEEYYETTDLEAKIQVTANLANFAYDPINYEHLVQSSVPQLFVELLGVHESRLVLNGIAGLCNCCLEPSIRAHLLSGSGNALSAISKLLHHPDPQILLHTLTTLIFLHSVDSSPSANCCSPICSAANIARVRQLQRETRNSGARHICTLATLFLKDCSHSEDVAIPPRATVVESIALPPS